jgi:extracellular factor (EF) 3-hydroxypalmitic acid methyl ester biosynthesis protein
METAQKNKIHQIDTRTEVSLQEKAFLVHGTRQVPIYAEYASRYSLFFRYIDSHHFTGTDEPVNLLIRNNGQSIELGPCRILSGPDLNGNAGRLVFLRDVYDMRSLLEDSKVVKLQSAFDDLPLIFARKANIKPVFKAYVADLKYDLQAYKNLFDDLDSDYGDEPEEVKKAVQEAIIETERPKYYHFFDQKLEELENLVEYFCREEHQFHGFYFRKQLWNFILCGPFGARSALKPRGYAGDSELMRMIYLNNYQGDSTFSKLMHKHAVEATAPQSVRNRIALIAQKISHSQNDSRISAPDKFKVLSVGSGQAFELQHIIKSSQDCDKFQFALFDQDAAALSEASALVSDIKKRLHKKPKVDFIQGSVRTMLFSRQLKQKWGQFHFIYCLGLFDYLTFRVARAVLNRLYQLLNPGGELIIGNFHVSNPSKYYMEYWVDWVLFHRTEKEFLSMLDGISPAKTSVLYDDTGSQMFLHIKKPD